MELVTMSFGLKWGKLRLDSKARSLLDRALADLNRTQGAKFHLIRHPSGKLTSCRVEDFWFCHVGDDGQPPQIWTLVVDARPEQRNLLPTASEADFAECCDLLGIRNEAEQSQFRDFLRPDANQTASSPISGTS